MLLISGVSFSTPEGGGFGGSGHPGTISLHAGSKHPADGIIKPAALEAAAFGARVGTVAPGSTAIGMVDRLTGSPDRKAALITGRIIQQNRDRAAR
jgi:NAD(P)-dependent dehydrogenase (short-subunit alcohol dehydrogenase family)